MDYALVDTGMWYAMFDPRDQRYSSAESQEKIEILGLFQLVLPWPTVYETLRTRFVRNPIALGQFERFLKSSKITYLDDAAYRDAAFEDSLDYSLRRKRPLSMVDCLIRLILVDVNTRIDYLATFNTPDFVDVCRQRGIEII